MRQELAPGLGGQDAWCWLSPLGREDWNPCFRIGVLNTFVPFMAIGISVAAWFVSSLRDKERMRNEAAEEVAQLNPESSHFYGAIPRDEPAQEPTWDSTAAQIPDSAAKKVFQTENAILVDEALTLKDELYTYTQVEQHEVQRRNKRILELVGSLLLVLMYLVGAGTSNAEWERSWLFVWIYFAVLSTAAIIQRRSFFFQKLLLTTLASIVSFSNLRTSLLSSGVKAITVMTVLQTSVVLFLLGLSWTSPFTQALSSEMEALYETMHKRTLYSEIRTAVPTPPENAQNKQTDLDRLVPSYSKSHGPMLPPPEQHASLLSRCLFIFVQPIIWKHFFKPITLPDVPQLMSIDRSPSVIAMFRIHNGPETARPLWLRLVRHFAWSYAYQALFAFFATILTLAPVYFLSHLLNFFTQRASDGAEAAPMHMGVLYASGMFVSQVLFSVCQSQSLMTGRHICVQIRAILTFEVLSKTIRRGVSINKMDGSSATPKTSDDDTEDDDAPVTDGAVMNLVSVDVNKLSELAAYSHFLFPQQPLSVLLGVVYIVMLLGWSAVVGLVLLVVAVPIQTYLSRVLVSVGLRMLRATDERLNLTNEVLACIKTVKFFAWEKPFEKRMNEARLKELGLLRLQFFFSILNHLTFIGTPMLVTMATFGAHTILFKQALTAQKAFTALALFNTLRGPLAELPSMIQWLLSAIVSVHRIDNYLCEPDTHKYEQLLGEHSRAAQDVWTDRPLDKVGFDHATFTYGAEPEKAPEDGRFMLHDLCCQFPVGKISIVVGPVGSGKSSILLAMLGEMQRIRGKTIMPCPIARSLVEPDPISKLTESTAYCSQSAWLLGTTIRQNILFGTAYDEDRYHEVLRACALEADLDILEHHDETEVGEKGTSLSGGQKARIALARAFYSYAKHILIDDALSAVDAHTAKHLCKHCFQGPLSQGRTIILVTHAVTLMIPAAAYAVVMDGGRVAAEGAPKDLQAHGHIEMPVEVQDAESKDSIETRPIDERELAARKKKTDEQRARKALADKNEEKLSRSQSSASLYWLYMKSVARSPYVAGVVWIALMSLYISIRAIDVSSGAWLRQWAGSYDQVTTTTYNTVRSWVLVAWHAQSGTVHDDKTWYYLKGYASIVLAFILVSFFTDVVQYVSSLKASQHLYSRLNKALLLATPLFFDKTPIGRIMNRLSRDMEDVDQELCPILQMTVENFISLVAIAAVICWATPYFLFVLGFVMALYYMIGAMYLSSSRDLKRIESIQRSPLYTVVGECIAGTITIRAYGDGERVMRQCLSLIDKWNRAFLLLWYENRWLSICCDLSGAGVTLIAALFLLFGGADAALAGFTLSYAITLVEVVLWLVRLYTNTEIHMNSVERIGEYITVEPERQGGLEPPAHWPTDSGAIQVRDLSVRYSPELPPALSNVSFDIQPGHKVGIVGRTGSGKSTLSLAFFRFLEAESGSIIIDGIDISSISLESLRRRLTIIPQDSQLFRGSIRSNLDPFGLTDDGDMWFALQRCQLAVPGSSPNAPGEGSVIKSLDDAVEQGGSNFSAGQRQLLSLARGLLKMRESRILILDESTANLDAESDALIQRTIREQMAPGATILTVAHRLKTIIDYDKVLVLGKGHVLEYDSPHVLLSDESSTFYKLCEQSGELATLKVLAAEHAQQSSRS